MDYYLVTLSDGSTTLVSEFNGPTSLHLQALPDGVAETDRHHLKGLDAQQFKDLVDKSATHRLSFDKMTGKVTMTPKTQNNNVKKVG